MRKYTITNYLILWFFLGVAAHSSASAAPIESTRPTAMANAISHLAELLPPVMAENWRQLSPELNVMARENVKNCIQYRAVLKNTEGTYPVVIRNLSISRACLNELDQMPQNFALADLPQSQILKGLFRVAVQLYLEGPGKPLNNSSIKKMIFANHYYMTPLTLGVDINGSVEQSLIQFWTETTLAYMTNPQFSTQHPDAYALLRDHVFSGVEFFSHGPLSQQTSDEIYPTFAKIKFLRAGNESWYMRYQMIKNAQRSIEVEYFTLDDDIFGQSFVALLLDAQNRGVHVKVMLDGRGSLLTSRGRLMRALSAAGAETVSYNPLLLGVRNLFKFFTAGPINAFVAANHDKVLIVDGTKVLTGGRNISSRYFLTATESNQKTFRDADIYAEFGEPFVAGLAAFNAEFYSEHAFRVRSISPEEVAATVADCQSSLRALEDRMTHADLSAETMGSHPEVANYKSLQGLSQFDATTSDQYYNVKCLDKTSMLLDENNFSEQLFELIRSSKRIVIQNPYITLTKKMRRALIEAATGPNQAEIYLSTSSPGTTDSPLTQAVFSYEWRKIQKEIPGIKIYAYKGANDLHAKIFVFDQQKVLISGYNLDSLSERFNSEFGLLVDSSDFASLVEANILSVINNDSNPYETEPEPSAKYGFFYLLSGLIKSWL